MIPETYVKITPKNPLELTDAQKKTNAIRAFRNRYGFRPSHFGKDESYYRRANTPKSQRNS